MASDSTLNPQEHQKSILVRQSGADAVYGIGLFGAWAYYMRRATTPQERIQAFFKGLFWPAFLVHDLLVFLEKK